MISRSDFIASLITRKKLATTLDARTYFLPILINFIRMFVLYIQHFLHYFEYFVSEPIKDNVADHNPTSG